MFREMRRKRQSLPEKECQKILQRGICGVLGVSGDDGYPYTVPLSYVYENGKLYFHCARTGHKLDSIARNGKVSFCVIDKSEVVPEKYTTFYRSVIVFGTARILSDDAEKRAALRLLIEKYAPNRGEETEKKLEKPLTPVNLVEISIERISGKESAELTEQRNQTEA